MFEMSPMVVAGSAIGIAIIVALLDWVIYSAIPTLKRIQVESEAMQECGHLGPPPSDEDHGQMLTVCRFFADGFVGAIEVVGQEKLDSMAAPFLLVFNHGSLLDTAIAPIVLKRKGRYPSAQGVTSLFGGLVGYQFGKWGVFTVNLEKGGAAFTASVELMKAGAIEVIFPEAWTWMDGSIGPFKTGAVRIARQASQELGKTVYIVPGYMHYGRYPGPWIKKFPIPIQWLVPLVFAFWYRRGVTVVIGDPIHPTLDLPPADARQATDLLRQKLIALKPGS